MPLRHPRTVFASFIVFNLLGLTACGGGGGGGAAAPAPLTSVALPETGQTLCYPTDGIATAPIACAGTGQDGDLKAGVAWPSPRFVVGTGAETGCVTDSLTGLMWVGSPSTVTAVWATALTDANGLTLCGFSDWRLPNVTELESLVNSEAANPATFLNGQGFTGVQPGDYWSSSSSAVSAGRAWLVNLFDGGVDPRNKTGSNYVWPVRAGQ